LGMSVIGTAVISQLSLSWGFLVLALPMLAIGVGNGGTFTTTSIATQNAIDPAVLGIGTATLVSFRSLGGSLALAAYGSIFTSTVSSTLKRNLPAGALPKGTKVSALVRAPDEIKALPTAVRNVVAQAITSGTARVFLFAMPLVFAGWLLALSLPELPLRRTNEAQG
jgi:hypothetical protein